MLFKNLEGKPKKESPKRTISTSGEFWSLQMISVPVRTLSLVGGGHEAMCGKDVGGGFGGGPTSFGGRNESQQVRWTPKGGEL